VRNPLRLCAECMEVSLVIMLSYINDYDINSFRFELLYDDGWVARMLNESRVVLVVSWLDLASRAFFSIALVAATADMKALLHYTSHEHSGPKCWFS
jgi:hypothetical protein